jgi:hypothetical protein
VPTPGDQRPRVVARPVAQPRAGPLALLGAERRRHLRLERRLHERSHHRAKIVAVLVQQRFHIDHAGLTLLPGHGICPSYGPGDLEHHQRAMTATAPQRFCRRFSTSPVIDAPAAKAAGPLGATKAPPRSDRNLRARRPKCAAFNVAAVRLAESEGTPPGAPPNSRRMALARDSPQRTAVFSNCAGCARTAPNGRCPPEPTRASPARIRIGRSAPGRAGWARWKGD